MNQYWLGIDGQKVGPLRIEQVRIKLNSGEATENTLCWAPGMDSWKKVSEFAEFASSVQKEKKTTTDSVPTSPDFETSKSPYAAPNTEPEGKEISPVSLKRRAFAKVIDLLVIGCLHLSIVTAFGLNFLELATSDNTFLLSALSVAMLTVFYESFALLWFGFTVGKFLLKVEVFYVGSDQPSFLSVALRTLRSWYSSGIGFLNVPGAGIVILLAGVSMFLHQQFYKKFGDYRWNLDGKFKIVNQGKVTAVNIFLIVALLFGIMILNSNLITPQLISFLENNPEFIQEVKKTMPNFDLETLKNQ